MGNEVIEIDEYKKVESNLPVTSQDVDKLKSQRELLRGFVQSQLREDIDYGIIPGTKEPSLLKPGAEKIARLFGLGIRVELADKELDRKDNFAIFTYRARIFQLNNKNVVIAECEGSCNSQEKKYRERSIYKNGQKVGTEATPICEILNTLQKMAQKRAIVGAVILGVGASDFFTQDIDDADDIKANGLNPDKVEPKRVQASVPNVKAATSNDMSQKAASGAFCEACGTELILSKAGSGFYCPDFNDKTKGEHTRFPVSKLEEFKETQQQVK